MEFHVAGELQLKARRPKSVDLYGTWSSCWVEEQRARDGWYSWTAQAVRVARYKSTYIHTYIGGDCRDKMADRISRSYRSFHFLEGHFLDKSFVQATTNRNQTTNRHAVLLMIHLVLNPELMYVVIFKCCEVFHVKLLFASYVGQLPTCPALTGFQQRLKSLPVMYAQFSIKSH